MKSRFRWAIGRTDARPRPSRRPSVLGPDRVLRKVSAWLGWLAAASAVALGALPPTAALAAEPLEVFVDATVRRGERRVEGTMRARVRLDPGERSVRLWLYPDRLAVPPAAMEERSWRWIYPGEIDRGGIAVSDVRVDGQPAATSWRTHSVGHRRGRDVAGSDLVVELPARPRGADAREVVLTLRFELRVPGRFGRLGADDGLLSLQAPWYPIVVGDDDAWAFEARHRARLRTDEGELLLGPRAVGGAGEVEMAAPYVPAAAAGRFHEHRSVVAGVQLVIRTPERLHVPPPPSRRGAEGLIDLAAVNVPGRIAEVAEQAIASARAFGVPVPERIVLSQIPSRTELTATAPGVVLFSDRLFQIFPLDQTLQFHRRALRRALFAHLARPLSAAADPAADRGWATDLRAVALSDLDEARRRRGTQSPQELLGLLSFHPAVDQLLYAPQIAFEGAYFAAIEERDRFRDDPARARRPLSGGRRVLEMARDAMSEEALERWMAMLVHARRSARAALREAGPELVERLPGWLAASGAPVNYRLADVSSERLPDGRWRHTVEIERQGADRIEPVEVRVHDTAGHEVTRTWEAAGRRGNVSFVTHAPLAGVAIDPRHRLPQSPELAEGHPRVDDATDLPWRPPILNGFLFNVFVTEEDFTGLLDFALRRRYDLEHTIGFRAERTRAFTGGTVRYTHGFGPKAHTNRRIAGFTTALSFDRLHSFFGDGDLGGWRAQLGVGLGLNTVSYSLDPREGLWGSASLTGGLAFRDDGTLGGTLRGGGRAGAVLPLGLVNALAVVIGGGFTAGDALRSELQALGGSNRLRGFESGEHLARGALFAVVEHRFTALRDLAINLAHLVWVREIQLAIFAGAGAAFDTVAGQEVVGAADVGAGVRVHYEYGGVQPGVITLDVGLPLTRADDRVFVDGELVRRRTPVGFYIGFDQYF